MMKEIHIIKKESIEELIESLFSEKIDNIVKNRYPVRFVLINDFKEQINFLKSIKTKHNIVELANLLEKNDKWITPDDIFSIINNLTQNKNYVILGLSEYFYLSSIEDIKKVLAKFTEIENLDNTLDRRIFVPIVGLSDIIVHILKNLSRISKEEWPPIYKINNNINLNLYCYLLEVDISNIEDYLKNKYKIVFSTKNWLSIHMENFPKNILITSQSVKTLINLSDFSKNILNVKNIKNYKEFLIEIIGINKIQFQDIEYIESESSFWKALIKFILSNEIYKSDIFNYYVTTKLGTNFKNIVGVIHIIFQLWKKRKLFDIWMIKNYLLSHFPKRYLTKILSSIEINSQFISNLEEKLWLEIFNKPDDFEFIEERQNLLEELIKEKGINRSIEDTLKEKLETIVSNKKKIELITGLLKLEKEILIKIYKSNPELESLIFKKYKELGYYLKDFVFSELNQNQTWIQYYFREYKKSKIKDEIQEKLLNLLKEKNKNEETFYEWYISFDSAKKIYNEEKNNVDKIIWIDALGLEWLALISSLLEENDFTFENLHVCRSYLPTITECNKPKGKNLISIKDLDEYIHSQRNYSYPQNIIDEIEIIKNIVEKELMTGETILVLSDHGLTTFASFQDINKYDFKKEEVNHEGRCAWINIDNPIKSNEDFIVVKNPDCKKEKKAVVSLRYISLSKPPKKETHGGATPEEVLVPIFKIVPKSKEIRFKIDKKEFIIIPQNAVIEIKITPIPNDTLLKDNAGNIYNIIFDNINKSWKVDLSTLEPGRHKLKVYINNKECDILDVEMKAGFSEEELF